MQDAVIDQPLSSRCFAQRVPAGVEAALVLGDVLVVRVQRPVRRGVGDVLEERRVRRARAVCSSMKATAWSLIASV